jgi:hypothetical protein
MANGEQSVPPGEQAGVWRVVERDPSSQEQPETYRPDGTENLTYNNPYGSEVERVWFDGRIVYALDCGEVELDFDEYRIARNRGTRQGGTGLVETRKQLDAINEPAPPADSCPTRRGRRESPSSPRGGRRPARSRRPR